jgi:Chaperone of endosialidase
MSIEFSFPLNPDIGDTAFLSDGGEVQWNGYAWIPVPESTPYPLDISLGGTGATSAPEALINLGGVNEAPDDGNPYSRQSKGWVAAGTGGGGGGVVYPIPVDKGGTGGTTTHDALTNLGGTTVGLGVFTAPTPADAQTSLGATAIGSGVFTAISQTAAQSVLGATTTGVAVFTATSQAVGRTALGATTVGSNVFTAATTAAAQTAIGATAIGSGVFTAATTAAAQTTLGATAIGSGVFTATTTAAAQTTLGATAIGSGVFTATTTAAAQTTLGGTAVGIGVFTAATTTAGQTALGATTVGSNVFTAATQAAGRAALGIDTVVSGYVPLTGGTMSGNLGISNAAGPGLILNKLSNGAVANVIQGLTNSKLRWQIQPGNGGSESGSNAGSDFAIYSYDDTGTYIANPFAITRSNSWASFGGNVTIVGADTYFYNGNMALLGSTSPYRQLRMATDSWALRWDTRNGDWTMCNNTGATLFTFSGGGVFTTSGINATNYNYATHLRAGGNAAAQAMIFNWSGQGGQPNWLWGGGDGTNMYVYNPSNFSVNYANSAGSAPANGGTAQNSNQVSGIGGWNYANNDNNPTYLWATNGDGQYQFLAHRPSLSVNYANSAGSAPANGGTSGNSNALGGQGPGYYINNAGSALVNERNNGAIQIVCGIGGAGDYWWPINPSDQRLKKNIAPSSIDALSEILRIEFKQFRFRNDLPWIDGKDDPVDHPSTFKIDDGRFHPIGVIAQQLLNINPDMVETEIGTWMTPKQDVILWRALRAIQQLKEENDTLKESIVNLSIQVQSIKDHL